MTYMCHKTKQFYHNLYALCVQTLCPARQPSWRTMFWAWGTPWKCHASLKTPRSQVSGSKMAPDWCPATGHSLGRGCCASSTCRTRTRASTHAGSPTATRCSATTPSRWQVRECRTLKFYLLTLSSCPEVELAFSLGLCSDTYTASL